MCCSESSPGWLLVSLGAPRPIASLQLVTAQDLTYTLALANGSSSGALTFVTVAQRLCDPCVINPDPLAVDGVVPLQLATYVLSGAVVATHVKLTVTWSSAGGVGGCFDLCDWCVLSSMGCCNVSL